MKLTLLRDIPDDQLFWIGSAFRLTNVGMNGVSADEDFYDYMLVESQDEDSMLILNVTIGNIKAGYIVCAVARAPENYSTVTSQALRRALGVKNIYYAEEM